MQFYLRLRYEEPVSKILEEKDELMVGITKSGNLWLHDGTIYSIDQVY